VQPCDRDVAETAGQRGPQRFALPRRPGLRCRRGRQHDAICSRRVCRYARFIDGADVAACAPHSCRLPCVQPSSRENETVAHTTFVLQPRDHCVEGRLGLQYETRNEHARGLGEPAARPCSARESRSEPMRDRQPMSVHGPTGRTFQPISAKRTRLGKSRLRVPRTGTGVSGVWASLQVESIAAQGCSDLIVPDHVHPAVDVGVGGRHVRRHTHSCASEMRAWSRTAVRVERQPIVVSWNRGDESHSS